ncbi:(2Fe-2S)-binding protein [Halioglobus japonicus]|uniref:Aromatic ring-hydroxylating dioxygenase subunit alpha n=1 Tax=Halioglobus japonicus TaxID=930805 RepID=A0AAP8MGC9_9GAMM|nr:aromatic ring-hydroxylating dioxygenase subunit alpha [Halioglobus japonicus]AQA19617.1 (2Fe-2S)-binding protein [Halioglobus japonicus]PLW87313.1 aromatic ring-hydroxylating dioxygenase subunit alpha [Halioglobus japonicus]GHD09061.1 (2Fe-2S)-binding protein [Halioglobus japonicus]
MSRTIELADGRKVIRSDGETYQEMLDKETNPVPDALRESTDTFLGSENIPTDRYLSREFHDKEVEHMWNRTWQAVCRETEIGRPGDFFTYDIARYSIVVTRTESGAIKGYHNACLHRGRALRSVESGTAREFKCPFHGFRWSLEGDFLGAPCQWDFPHIKEEEFSLPEVLVDTWGGWVFINMDLQAESLQSYMGILPQHFERWTPENTFKALHIEKVIECNWKLAWEAFIESYHTVATHPQIMTYLGDSNSQYDIWGDNVSRTISPMGVVSPHLEDIPPNQTVNEWLHHAMALPEDETLEVPEGMSAREYLADFYFKMFGEQYGVDVGAFSTQSEIMDSILYSLFPNFAPWAGFQPNLTYRMKPYGDRHDMCTMEIIFLMRYPEDQPRPDDVPVQRLDKDQLFSEAEGMEGGLGKVFDQDFSNLKMVQKGLHNLRTGEVVLANYQEVRIRHFHQTLSKYIDD